MAVDTAISKKNTKAARSDVEDVVGLDRIAVTTDVAAEMLGVSEGTLRNWRCRRAGNVGPAYSKIGGRVVYPIAELKAYVARNLVSSVRC